MADEIEPQNPPQRKAPSLLACITCRKAHVKCNGKQPNCERCVEKGITCVWVESRRGIRSSKRESSAQSDRSSATSSSNQGRQQQYQQQQQQQPTRDRLPMIQPSNAGFNYGVASGPPSGHLMDAYGFDRVSYPSSPVVSPGGTNHGADLLLDLFYKYLHPSHPFVLPSTMRDRIPEFLRAVMRFAGSHFVPYANRDGLKDTAVAQVVSQAPDNGFKVQAFALLAMVSFSRAEQEEGQAYLRRAIELALWLGLNNADFASRFGNNEPVVEESWRRTWWDLFIVEGLISSFSGQADASKLRTVKANVLLPGDCESYNASIPSRTLKSFEEMQDRAFSDDDYQWSSFAYKIEAMHLLHSVEALGPDTFASSSSQVESLDQKLSSFRLSLPRSKRDALKVTGEVDEVMFGALMTASCAEISLHRPRSSLVYVKNHYRTLCTPEPPQGLTAVEYRAHDVKAVRAANAITNLLTMPSAPTMHTPCFTCALTVATTVQLPAMVQNQPTEGIALKERIQLAITAMGSISEVWPMALATKSQVAGFAREILKGNNEPTPPEPLPASRPQSTVPSISRPSTTTPSLSEPSLSQPFEQQDFFVANQDWLMDLMSGDGGLSAAEVDAWIHNTTNPGQSWFDAK